MPSSERPLTQMSPRKEHLNVVDGQHLVQNEGGQLNQNYDAEGTNVCPKKKKAIIQMYMSGNLQFRARLLDGNFKASCLNEWLS